jgi:hypothetical protein
VLRTLRIWARQVARSEPAGAQAATGTTLDASARPVVASMMLADACAEAELTAGESPPARASSAEP